MLASQLALALEPVVEEVRTSLHDFQVLERHVVESLGLIVAVDFLQTLVEERCKLVEVGRFLGELYQPLVTALGIAVHIDWSCRVFSHLCPCLLTGIVKSLLGIIHDEFFAEGIDEVLGTTCDDKLVWILARKLHGITYQISPQATRGRDDHRIVLAHLDALQGYDGRMVGAKLIHRNKLIEDIIIYHERHGRVARIVLQAKESLAGIVGLHIVHVGRRDELLVLLAIRSEGDATMEEHLQIRPHFLQMLLAREFHDTHQHTEHPTRDTRYVGHILVHGLPGDAVTLHLEVAQESRLLLRHTYHIGKRIDVLDEDGTEVAHQTARNIIVRGMATSENQTLPIKEFALWVITEIIGHGIIPTLVVDAMQAVMGNRNKLAFVIGGTR